MKEHPSFWVSLWQSDDFVSLVNRMVMMASSSAATWATVRGYLPGELAGLLALFVLTVSQKFSSWNRGRATAKAAAEALGVAGLPAEVASEPMSGPGWSRNPNQATGEPPDMRLSGTRVGPGDRNEADTLQAMVRAYDVRDGIKPGTAIVIGKCDVCGVPIGFAAGSTDPKFCSRACWAKGHGGHDSGDKDNKGGAS